MKNILILSLVLCLFSACNQRKKEIENITALQLALDSVMKQKPVLLPADRVHAENLAKAYHNFVKNYPDDSLASKYMFQEAVMKQIMQDYPATLEILTTIPEKYPASKEAPDAITAAAAICENFLKDCDKAAYYLKQLGNQYPDHPAAVNIDMQIQYVCDPQGYLNAVRGEADTTDLSAE
jgi:hypothetical protein